jgi:hypothetical protein
MHPFLITREPPTELATVSQYDNGSYRGGESAAALVDTQMNTTKALKAD